MMGLSVPLARLARETFEQANLMFGWFDVRGSLRACSTAFARRLGHPTQASAVKTFDASGLGFDADVWSAFWSRLGATGRVRQAIEARDRAGDPVPLRLDARSITLEGEMFATVELVEVSEEISFDALNQLQAEILEKIARGERMAAVMDRLSRGVEDLVPGVVCSILSLDSEGRLHPVAAPSMPAHVGEALDGLEIGPDVGSCGTAAYTGEEVEVLDIDTDSRWGPYKGLMLPLGLKACWSSPIKSRADQVVGTFAFYFRTCRGPSDVEREIVAASCHLAAIAMEHEEQQARINELAYFDQLTGLPNRASFRAATSEALASLTAGEVLAIHYIDLDDFKGVNDTLGHPVGDRLLQEVADRLEAVAGGKELVARFGGDEFAILQRHVDRAGDITRLAHRLQLQLAAPVEIDGHLVTARASIGIVRAPHDGTDLDELIKRADLALYCAKADGRGTYRFYTCEMFEKIRRRRTLEADLRLGVQRSELDVHYQPFVDFKTGEIRGVEALVRWRHPTRGMVSPAEFIPLAEEIGLIDTIGDWVLHRAVAAAAAMPRHVAVAVNLSAMQLKRPAFVLGVVHALGQAGLSPDRLEFEITETVLLAEDPSIYAALRQLRDLGVRISLDDFGTGYSSLSYLRSFTVDKIKIDRSFVGDLIVSRDAMAIVRAVIAMADELGMETTAEGIETEAQAEALKSLGCTLGQGYHFARPQPLDQVMACFTDAALLKSTG